MMKSIHKLAIATVLIAASAMSVEAQNNNDSTSVNRTVIVEQNYIPIIQDAVKMNQNPPILAAPVIKKSVEYAYFNQPLLHLNPFNLPAMLPPTKNRAAAPLYISLGGGTQGNIKAIADYRAVITPRDVAHITLNYGGKSAYLTNKNLRLNDYNSYLYSGSVRAAYVHSFNNFYLGGEFQYINTRYNYLPISVNNKQQDHQQYGEIVASSRLTSSFNWKAKIGYTNYLKTQTLWKDNFKLQERKYFIEGEGKYDLTYNQQIGLNIGTNLYSYNRQVFQSYATIHLSPRYIYQEDDLELSAGANIDLSFNFDTRFRISPNINLGYTFADKYQVYTNIIGGNNVNTFKQMQELCIYGETQKQQRSTYIPLNASLGVKGAPIEGLSFDAFWGYEVKKNDLVYFGTFNNILSTAAVYHIDYTTVDTKTPYLGVNMSYDYKGMIQASASAIFRNWKTDMQDNYSLIAFKPQQELNANISYLIMPKIRLDANYQYVHRVGQLPPISNLCIGGHWNFSKHFTAAAEVYNILNNKYFYFDHYISDGISGLMSISFKW